MLKGITHLDDVDRRIVEELQRDASSSHAELASRVGSSPASVWRRIKQLEQSGVLLGVVRLVDPYRLGQRVNVLCEVRLKDYSSECVDAFNLFVREQRRILEWYSMSGDWDYLMRVIATDVADYEQFLMRSLLKHPSVAGASSHFTLSVTKYETALPI